MALTEQDLANLHAVQEMLQSDGWQVFETWIDQEWGDGATLRKVEASVGRQPMGDQDAVTDSTQHVLSQQKAVRAMVQLPRSRVQALSEKPKSFNPLRRGPSR
jgi:hypothetical protein